MTISHLGATSRPRERWKTQRSTVHIRTCSHGTGTRLSTHGRGHYDQGVWSAGGDQAEKSLPFVVFSIHGARLDGNTVHYLLLFVHVVLWEVSKEIGQGLWPSVQHLVFA